MTKQKRKELKKKSAALFVFVALLLMLSDILTVVALTTFEQVEIIDTTYIVDSRYIHQATGCQNVNGTLWVFFGYQYTGQIGLRAKYSTDNGTTWSTTQTISTTVSLSNPYLNTYYDGTYLYYSKIYGTNSLFRRGIFYPNGSITWSAGEQTYNPSTTGAHAITVDENGYSYFLYSIYNGGNTILKMNENNDGTLSAVNVVVDTLINIGVSGASLNGGYKLFTYGDRVFTFCSAYNMDEVIRFNTVGITNQTAGTPQNITDDMNGFNLWDATQGDDSIYISYLDDSNNIQFFGYNCTTSEFSGGSVTVAAAQSTSAPLLVFDEQEEFVYILWAEGQNIYYVTYDTNSQTFSEKQTLTTSATELVSNVYINAVNSVENGINSLAMTFSDATDDEIFFVGAYLDPDREVATPVEPSDSDVIWLWLTDRTSLWLGLAGGVCMILAPLFTVKAFKDGDAQGFAVAFLIMFIVGFCLVIGWLYG